MRCPQWVLDGDARIHQGERRGHRRPREEQFDRDLRLQRAACKEIVVRRQDRRRDRRELAGADSRRRGRPSAGIANETGGEV